MVDQAEELDAFLSEDTDKASPQTNLQESEPTPSDDGNPPETPAAPVDGQPVQGEDQKETQEPKADEKPLSQGELDKKAKELLGLEVDQDTADHWKQKFEASSREGREKAQFLASVNEKLESLGLKVVTGEKGVEFVADEKFVGSKSESLTGNVFDALSQDQKDMAVENPRKFAQIIIGKTLEATRQPVPTATKDAVRIPETVRAEARQEVIGAKSKDDARKPELPDYEALEPYINAVLADPSTPKEFTSFAHSSKENFKFALKLLYGRVHQRIAPLIAAQLDRKAQLAKKKESAVQDASLTSEGTRSGKTRAKPTAEQEADEVVNAHPW